MSESNHRVVVVSRPTEYQALLARHATHGQASFFLSTRGQQIEVVEERHHLFEAAMARVLGAIPRRWRRARVVRDDLDRFLFEPDDIVIVVGQDGLVANTAKYLHGQVVMGLNSDPSRYDGVLVRHEPAAAADLLADLVGNRSVLEHRTMVEAVLDGGQRLVALNELFIGHQSHQSALYELACSGQVERQSSSGMIICTGTGATGWALSINRSRGLPVDLPGAEEEALAFFVREAFPSVASCVDLTEGVLASAESLQVISRMNSGGVVFGDGIEDDRLEFSWGRRVEVGISSDQLCLLAG
jgi:NAD kinase